VAILIGDKREDSLDVYPMESPVNDAESNAASQVIAIMIEADAMFDERIPEELVPDIKILLPVDPPSVTTTDRSSIIGKPFSMTGNVASAKMYWAQYRNVFVLYESINRINRSQFAAIAKETVTALIKEARTMTGQDRLEFLKFATETAYAYSVIMLLAYYHPETIEKGDGLNFVNTSYKLVKQMLLSTAAEQERTEEANEFLYQLEYKPIRLDL
jgi:hypothetical protein